MSARDRVTLTPAHEQQIGSEWSGAVTAGIRYDFHTVRCAVTPLERGGAIVNSHVTADSVRVALGMIGGKESSHFYLGRRLPTISLNRFPVKNATFAGRSASRRIR
jgi:hypothetical protein